MTAGLDAGSDGGLTILQCHIPAEEHEMYCRVGEGKVGEVGGRGLPLQGYATSASTVRATGGDCPA